MAVCGLRSCDTVYIDCRRHTQRSRWGSPGGSKGVAGTLPGSNRSIFDPLTEGWRGGDHGILQYPRPGHSGPRMMCRSPSASVRSKAAATGQEEVTRRRDAQCPHGSHGAWVGSAEDQKVQVARGRHGSVVHRRPLGGGRIERQKRFRAPSSR